MRHIIFEEAESYKVAVLIKGSAFKQSEINSSYVIPLNRYGITNNELIAFTLKYNEVGKAPAKFIKEYLDKLLPALDSLGVKFLYVADSNYFKTLTKLNKAEPHFGYVLPCKYSGFEHMQVVLGLNHQSLIYNPELQNKLDLSIKTLAEGVNGTYVALGSTIIHSAKYPSSEKSIKDELEKLHQYPELTCDIEAFSLRFNKAGIGTISFAWDQHNGIAFECDYMTDPDVYVSGTSALAGMFVKNPRIRAHLKEFFSTYKGKLTWHNAAYDVKVIIYTLWMKHDLDTEGLLEGLDVMTRSIDDTKIIAYLATNTTAGNVLGLKPLAHEFAGNWAVEEITDIRAIPSDKLLQYNLVDCLSTWYVKNKYYPIMVQDQQEALYKELMLPSLKLLLQVELTGMPMDIQQVYKAEEELTQEANKHIDVLTNSPVIKVFNLLVQKNAMDKANAKLKTKQHPIEKFADEIFNPNSPIQLQKLLYEMMGLPILDYTDTKQPATGAETIAKLINHTDNPDYIAILEALIGYSKVDKILTAFIPSFKNATPKPDGKHYLHGSFNIGGTVSGRLSSSNPNLQQIPSNSTYGKLIKKCFSAPNGWIFAGADFNSLEDYISALTTKDPNKLDVYLKGFDGHCLRAAYYFKDQLPHIDITDPTSVNSIKKSHPHLRQESKTPTFALTYAGTYHTLMANLGWEEERAKAVETAYHELYKVSDDYVRSRLEQASKDGYVEVAFGLRVRTPLLKQVIFGASRMPHEASAEGRTAGNALGQSYGLLNNRAAVDFMQKVWASPYKYDIKPVALIHDAIYLLIRDDINVVDFANKELINSMRWQDLPEIQHPTVKLGAALDLFYPNWSNAITLPPDIDRTAIKGFCEEELKKLKSCKP